MKLSIRTKLIFLLFFLTAVSVGLISQQSYKIALKDMSNNAKSTSRIYAKNISNLIEHKMQTIKEKVLLAVINESMVKRGAAAVLERIPEVLAIIEFNFVKEDKRPERGVTFINPNYEIKYSLKPETFNKLIQKIDFATAFRDKESLNVDILNKDIAEVMIYSFPIKIQETKSLKMYVTIIIPDVILTAIGGQQGGYVNYLIDSNGNILAHPDSMQVGKDLSKLSFLRDVFSNKGIGERTMEYIDENKKEVIGSFFRIQRSDLGVVSKIFSDDAYAEAVRMKIALTFISVFVFLATLFFSLYFAKTLTDPIRKLSSITNEIAQGNFLVDVDVRSNDEIGNLAHSFTHMGEELYKREEALKHAQSALVQSEKLAAFGQLGAGIAHEVKNPLTGIIGHAQLSKEKLAKNCNPQEMEKSLGIIEKEAVRCKNIIENLLRFARQEKAELKPDNITKIVLDSVDLVDHQLTIKGVKIVREVSEGFPQVLVNSNQIQQVLMNLMLNAEHAMEGREPKTLTVRLLQGQPGYARVEVEDTGSGMTPEIKQRIFEPFFTTKPPGKGTGLGLSVSYGIIKDHRGIIDVESEYGRGTVFVIQLPYLDPSAVANPVPVSIADDVPPFPPSNNILPPPPVVEQQGRYAGEDPKILKHFEHKNVADPHQKWKDVKVPRMLAQGDTKNHTAMRRMITADPHEKWKDVKVPRMKIKAKA